MDGSKTSTAAHLLLILGCTVQPDGTPSAALRRRVESALRRSKPLREAQFLGIGGAPAGGPAEATVIERLLREAGVPADAIATSAHGRNTIESLRACWPLLAAARARSVTFHVCTDGYHALRCRVILALWGIQTHAAPAPRTGLSRGQLFVLRWRDRAALLKDVPLALAWRLSQKREGAREH